MPKDAGRALSRALAECFTADELVAMMRDAVALSRQGTAPASAWDAMADALAMAHVHRKEAFPEDPEDCEHSRWNPDNRQCLDCGDISPEDLPPADGGAGRG